VHLLGDFKMDEGEMIAFARLYDPQNIHIDAAFAAKGPYGGLIASGWHTGGLMMRLLVENFLSNESSLGSPGVDELRWPAPARPGDRLRVQATIEDARPSNSKPDRGIVTTLIEVLNQDDTVVMTMRGVNFVLRRPAAK